MNAPWLDGVRTRNLFFTGKGGVGKTSLASATAIALAESGLRTLIVSTDPASNLDEVFGTELSAEPSPIPGVALLEAMNIDPEDAAQRYRDRAIDPYRGILPEAALRGMEEGLSGACTTEIAAFDEFTALLADSEFSSRYDRIVFDTAPTGHTLRLLSLPAAWTTFMETNTTGTSCLGPLAALQKQREVYRESVEALKSDRITTVILVARPDSASLKEAARAAGELRDLGVDSLRLVVNGVFTPSVRNDSVADAFASRAARAMADLPRELRDLPMTTVPLKPANMVGIASLRSLAGEPLEWPASTTIPTPDADSFPKLVEELAAKGRGVVMTMGKGGVGKTTVAAAVATELATRGHSVLLTTTDPAAHIADAVQGPTNGLRMERIDPSREVAEYTREVLETAGADLDSEGLALLEEDLRSPCTEEIAVFRAFAEAVAHGEREFVVVDTAPTGHTILLLDAAEAYHREVLRSTSELPDSVRQLLPRLRDPAFTSVLIVTLPEPTPVHEAERLQADLRRAGIEPYAWVINQSLSLVRTSDPVLRAKAALEAGPLAEAEQLAGRLTALPWAESNRPVEAAVSLAGR